MGALACPQPVEKINPAPAGYVKAKYSYELTVHFTFIIVTSFSSKRVLVFCGWREMPVKGVTAYC
jgi:hypothetical protein